MAAFRGLNVREGLDDLATAGCSVDLASCASGMGFCASCSDMLYDGCFSKFAVFCCGDAHEDPLLQFKDPLAIDVSGTPTFRGGGGPGSKVEGR